MAQNKFFVICHRSHSSDGRYIKSVVSRPLSRKAAKREAERSNNIVPGYWRDDYYFFTILKLGSCDV